LYELLISCSEIGFSISEYYAENLKTCPSKKDKSLI
jgi:hypothetical protein